MLLLTISLFLWIGILVKDVMCDDEATPRLDAHVTLRRRCAQSHSMVAFMAELSRTIGVTSHYADFVMNLKVVFDEVKLNIGDAYNPTSGVFSAPVGGTYLFSVTACTDKGPHIALHVMLNESVLGKIVTGDPDYGDCASKTLLGHLKAGDQIYVKVLSDSGNLLALDEYGHPAFMGVLIQAD